MFCFLGGKFKKLIVQFQPTKAGLRLHQFLPAPPSLALWDGFVSSTAKSKIDLKNHPDWIN